MKKYARLLCFYVVTLAVQFGSQYTFAQKETSLELSSSAFKDGEAIPSLYTGDGKDVSPPLAWKNIPKDAHSFALICEDPDAPNGNWIHWVVYNIPPTLDHIDDEGKNLPSDVGHGKNGLENIAYEGPNPPPGKKHHYHFTLYALDTALDLKGGDTLVNSIRL